MAGSRHSARSRSTMLVSGAVMLLVIIPLYIVAVTTAIRSDLFDLAAGPLSHAQQTTIWTFVGASLAATVSLLGVLFTRNQSIRAERRLVVDSAVKGIALIKNDDGTYAPRAIAGGALACLVSLGHPLIGMRTLAAAWDDGAVDSSTAIWLVNEVLVYGSPQSQVEAARLFRNHADDLCRSRPNTFDMPAILLTRWPNHLPSEAREALIDGLCILLASKEKSWWLDGYRWASPIFESIVHTDPNRHIKTYAATVLQILTYDADDSRFFEYNGKVRTYAQMKRTAQCWLKHSRPIPSDPGTSNCISDVKAWAQSNVA